MDPATNGNGWKLEVVRGQDAGRSFALKLGEVVLGNAPGNGSGLNLSAQESETSPRRMAARHASVAWSASGLTVRDLESPGGTFVNRQRVLPGQARLLQDGDVIQLGGVQLKVVGTANRVVAPPEAPDHLDPVVYPIPGGPICRSWDDLLTASAQKWDVLRDELISGRLSRYLASIGRSDLAPSPGVSGNPDERLDAWLGQLPTTREARPELSVHPSRLVIRAVPGGGTLRRSVQVANVGLRLLQSTARVEPQGVSWLKLDALLVGQPFATIEGTEVGLHLLVPETLSAPLTAELVIDGNGGSKRITIVLEAESASDPVIERNRSSEDPASSGLTMGELIGRQSLISRFMSWTLASVMIRLLVGLASGSLGGFAMVASGGDVPGIPGVAVMMAGLGGILGGWLACRRGGSREIPNGAFAGGCAGVILSAALVACCRSIEPILGEWSTSVIAVSGLWAVIGAALVGLSTFVVKGKS